MAKASTTLEINAPLKRVYEVVTDFKRYPEFVSGTQSVKILTEEKNYLEVEFKIDAVKTVTYSIAVDLEPLTSMRWRLIKGDFMKSNNGSWSLKETKKGEITTATYDIEVGFGFLVPSSIANLLISKHLPKMLSEFKQRAETYEG